MSEPTEWPEPLRLSAVGRTPIDVTIVPDAARRVRIARDLGLDALDSLEADLKVTPWLDGAAIDGRWRARIEQTCGVSLEPFQTALEGEFTVRVVPADSPNAPKVEGPEIAVDPEAEDPPDVLEDDRIDLGAYVLEHLALEIDPFPRKPGAVFTPPDEPEPPSPFAVLRDLKPRKEGG
ncbi:MAG: DUF177 domain-containing protein [Caulobacteraceae bacterium]